MAGRYCRLPAQRGAKAGPPGLIRINAGARRVGERGGGGTGVLNTLTSQAVPRATRQAAQQVTRRVTLAGKVAFLSRAAAYAHCPRVVERRETHMSWVFLAGERVYKLKKPVRFPYLDYSTMERREAACRAELALNRRLAADVYLEVVPLTVSGGRLTLGGDGPVADWLVAMRRLDERHMLDCAIATGHVSHARLDDLVRVLQCFYRGAARVAVTPARHLYDWRRALVADRRLLLDARLGAPAGLVRHVDATLHAALEALAPCLVRRVTAGLLVDGHGDLRPEHVWLGDSPRIIDCLEFNARLRAVDPLDELAFLTLECRRLGAPAVARYLETRMARALGAHTHAPLTAFYRAHRAMLRARLAFAHLLEPVPRVPARWPALARGYLHLAAADALCLRRWLAQRQTPGAAAQSPRTRGHAPSLRDCSVHEQVVQRAPAVQTRDGLGQ